MPVVNRHHQLFSHPERRKRRLSALSVHLEPLARFQFRPSSPPRRLSSWFGLRLAPSETHQKSDRHPADRSGRQLAASPPTGKLLCVGLGQIAQRPQEPIGGRGHLDPNLRAAFSRLAVELAAGRSQFAFQKTDAVFDAEAFVVNRFGLARRRRFGLRRAGNEYQPERPFVATLTVGLVFDHTIEDEPLLRPLPHPYIIPAADFDATAAFKPPLLTGGDRRHRSRVIELNLPPSHPWTPEAAILWRRQIEAAVVTHAPKNRDEPPRVSRRLQILRG